MHIIKVRLEHRFMTWDPKACSCRQRHFAVNLAQSTSGSWRCTCCFLADLIVCCSAGTLESCNNLLVVLEDQGSLSVMEFSGVIFCSGQGHNIAKGIWLPSSFVCGVTLTTFRILIFFYWRIHKILCHDWGVWLKGASAFTCMCCGPKSCSPWTPKATRVPKIVLTVTNQWL